MEDGVLRGAVLAVCMEGQVGDAVGHCETAKLRDVFSKKRSKKGSKGRTKPVVKPIEA